MFGSVLGANRLGPWMHTRGKPLGGHEGIHTSTRGDIGIVSSPGRGSHEARAWARARVCGLVLVQLKGCSCMYDDCGHVTFISIPRRVGNILYIYIHS